MINLSHSPRLKSLLFKSFLGLTAAITVFAAPAFATALHELSPSQIAADVTRNYNSETGRTDYVAQGFDPFEGSKGLAGIVALRSASPGQAISGAHISSGALLDVEVVYQSGSSDPYDIKGYDRAGFLSGEPADLMMYNNEVLNCSRDVREVTYDRSYYRGASYGFLAGIYRPFPRYRGHSHYRSQRLGYWRRPLTRRVYDPQRRRRVHDYRDRDHDSRVRRDRRGDHSDRDGRRDRTDRDRDRSDRDRTHRDDRRRDRSDRDGRGSSPTITTGRRGSTDTVSVTAPTPVTRRTPSRTDRPRVEPRRRVTSTSTAPTPRRTPNTTRPVHRPETRTAPTPSTRRTPNATRPVERPQTRATSRTEPRTAPRPQRRIERSPQVDRPQRQTQQPSRSSTPKATRSRPTRSSVSRSTDKTFNRNQKFSGKSRNFYPRVGGYARTDVYVSENCVKSEKLSVHIPRDRLEAGRFEGLTVLLVSRVGEEVPVYLPPNYVEGFLQSAGPYLGSTYTLSSYVTPSQSGYSGTYGSYPVRD